MLRNIVFLGLVLFIWASSAKEVSALANEAQNQTIDTVFYFTESVQTYTVPAGVTSIEIDAYGARGGHGYENGTGKHGGDGGRVQATMSVTPGEVLNIYVGARGIGYPYNCCSFTPGWNGGGTVSNNLAKAGYGGGATDIRVGGTTLNDRILVAGGGGGAQNISTGGVGGGLTGGNSEYYAGPSYTIGKGGTQTAGGQAGCWWGYSPCGYNGTLGTGGNSNHVGGNYSGAGGGGWYGGGSGAFAGGGGGSSYTDATLFTNVIHTQGANNGHGKLVISFTNPCPSTLSLNDTISDTQSYQAADSITAQQVLTSTADVDYQAGTIIVLKSGFQASSGSNFRAFINSCGSTARINYNEGADSSSEEIFNEEFVSPIPNTLEDKGLVCYPNPFTQHTTIEYTLREDSPVTLQISDITGRLVRQLLDEKQAKGVHQVTFDARNLPAGLYLGKLRVGDEVRTVKLLLQ